MGLFGKKEKQVNKLKQLLNDQAQTIANLSTTLDGYGIGLGATQWQKNTQQFESFVAQMLLATYLRFYTFAGLPFDTKEFARHLYTFGTTMVVNDGVPSFGMCVPSKWDKNNKIIEARILYNRPDGSTESGKVYKFGEFALLWDVEPHMTGMVAPGRVALDNIIVRQISECFSRLNINIILSSGKLIMQVPDEAIAASVKKELGTLFSSDSPFGVIVNNGVGQQIEFKQPDYDFANLFSAIKQYYLLAYQSHGIGNGGIGIDKQERLITDEADSMEPISNYIYQNRLESIKTFMVDFYMLTDIELTHMGV